MRHIAFIAVLALAPCAASAATERCLIEVDGEPYVLGRCNVDRGTDGSFSIGTGDRKSASPYFAYLSPDGGKALAYWNAYPGSTHAHTSLGEMRKEGSCWINERAKLCAWPMPSKPGAGMMNTRAR